MPQYNLEARFVPEGQPARLDAATVAALWELYVEICRHWRNVAEPEKMKSRFVAFLENRMDFDACYAVEYRQAVAVIAELTKERGRDMAYRFLLSDREAQNTPPVSRLERARQRVAGEFIKLQLSLGGFKGFTGARNFPGYIAGTNGSGPTPYRTYPGAKP